MSRHRAGCHAAARWALRQTWCDLAVVEISAGAGQLDVLALTTTLREDERARALERWEQGRERARNLGYRYSASKPRVPRPTVAAIEVKVSRSDMLADLRARKLLKYEPIATRCYLAAHRDCWLDPKLKDKARVQELRELGLPDHWGVVLLRDWTRRNGAPGWNARCIRPARDYGNTTTRERRDRLTIQAAISMCWRQLT